jgi:hypothetical protein
MVFISAFFAYNISFLTIFFPKTVLLFLVTVTLELKEGGGECNSNRSFHIRLLNTKFDYNNHSFTAFPKTSKTKVRRCTRLFLHYNLIEFSKLNNFVKLNISGLRGIYLVLEKYLLISAN